MAKWAQELGIPRVDPTKLFFFANEEFFFFFAGKLAFLLHTEKKLLI